MARASVLGPTGQRVTHNTGGSFPWTYSFWIGIAIVVAIVLHMQEIVRQAQTPMLVLFEVFTQILPARSAQANDTLVLSGPVKNWRPRFTYHGFRYVEVYGYPGALHGSVLYFLEW